MSTVDGIILGVSWPTSLTVRKLIDVEIIGLNLVRSRLIRVKSEEFRVG